MGFGVVEYGGSENLIIFALVNVFLGGREDGKLGRWEDGGMGGRGGLEDSRTG